MTTGVGVPADREQRTQWIRSRCCDSGACVEIAFTAGQVLVRDAAAPDLPALRVSQPNWTAFLRRLRDDGCGVTAAA